MCDWHCCMQLSSWGNAPNNYETDTSNKGAKYLYVVTQCTILYTYKYETTIVYDNYHYYLHDLLVWAIILYLIKLWGKMDEFLNTGTSYNISH